MAARLPLTPSMRALAAARMRTEGNIAGPAADALTASVMAGDRDAFIASQPHLVAHFPPEGIAGEGFSLTYSNTPDRQRFQDEEIGTERARVRFANSVKGLPRTRYPLAEYPLAGRIELLADTTAQIAARKQNLGVNNNLANSMFMPMPEPYLPCTKELKDLHVVCQRTNMNPMLS